MHRYILAAAALIAAPAAAQDAASIKVVESDKYGEFLATEAGRPLYLFTADTRAADGKAAEISCTTPECLNAWPLVEAADTPHAGDGVGEGMLGTVDYEGRKVMTYHGWPLYYFTRDEDTDAPQGQDVESFGGEWYLITPEGEKVHAE